mgnify:CR=1 FL=1
MMSFAQWGNALYSGDKSYAVIPKRKIFVGLAAGVIVVGFARRDPWPQPFDRVHRWLPVRRRSRERPERVLRIACGQLERPC